MFSHSVKVHPGGGGRPGRRDEQKARELDLDALEQTVYASATDLDALEAAMEMATYSAHVPHDAAPGDELELRNPDGLVVRARLVELGGGPRAAPRRPRAVRRTRDPASPRRRATPEAHAFLPPPFDVEGLLAALRRDGATSIAERAAARNRLGGSRAISKTRASKPGRGCDVRAGAPRASSPRSRARPGRSRRRRPSSRRSSPACARAGNKNVQQYFNIHAFERI